LPGEVELWLPLTVESSVRPALSCPKEDPPGLPPVPPELETPLLLALLLLPGPVLKVGECIEELEPVPEVDPEPVLEAEPLEPVLPPVWP
jgi:hypothetical protein